MRRTAFVSRGTITPKPGRCKHCRKRLDRIGDKIHSECVGPWWEANQGKVRTMAAKADRVATKKKLRDMEGIPELKKAAQREFNSYIRARDMQAGHPCISSGRVLDWSGNGVDAGHYRSVGSAPHLRYNEDNCHAQSKHDNQFRAGNAVDYRLGLIKRIGIARVEALEADNTPRHYTHDELRQIAAEYRGKLKALKASA